MVVHNDKWKKKATREYHKKHGTQPDGRGRGRGRGVVENEPVPGQLEDVKGDEGSVEEEVSNAESGEEEEEKEARRERSKYARRKIESNAWRFETEEPDPYLGNSFTVLANGSNQRRGLRTPGARLRPSPCTSISGQEASTTCESDICSWKRKETIDQGD